MKKRVLFINMNFYEYDYEIQKEISNLGFDVDMFCDKAPDSFYERIVRKYKNDLFKKRNYAHQERFIAKCKQNAISYDVIFVIVGRHLSRNFLQELKLLNPNAKFILHLWDDIDRIENFINIKDVYDRITTFDSVDSMNYNYILVTKFYTNDFVFDKSYSKSNNIFFVGADHSDRREFVEKIINQCDKLEKDITLVMTRYQFFKKKIFSTKLAPFVKFSNMSLKEMARRMKECSVAIEVQHPTQNGLTMRSIEAMSAGTKIITTNKHIKEYDFYRPENVLVVDRKNPVVTSDFLNCPYQEISNDVKIKYSLNSWVKTIFAGLE